MQSMKGSKRIKVEFLFGVIGLGTLVVSACTQLGSENTSTAPAGESPAATNKSTGEAPASTPGNQNLAQMMATNDSFKTLSQALQAAGLTETLVKDGPYTVFAPTDKAFAALPQGTLENLLKPENKEELTQILSYHMVPGQVTSSQLTPGQVKTVEGSPVTIRVDNANRQVTVNDAKVIQVDIPASNGVIYAIDKVNLPPQVQ